MPLASPIDRAAGILLILDLALVALGRWGGGTWMEPVEYACAAAVAGLLAARASRQPRVFVGIGVVLSLIALATLPGGAALIGDGLAQAAFIAAFFAALATLRHAAETSPSIRDCGLFLASRPPGQRYAALTLGGAAFGTVLNYGSIALLGSLATASAEAEPNPEIREIRTRRMLLATARGLVAMLPWSPLSFAIAITTALIPGASWAGVLPYALVSGLLLASIGWAMDSIFKPRLSAAASAPGAGRAEPEPGGWARTLPLVTLLAVIGGGAATLHLATGVSIVGVVMVWAPLVSAAWVWLQGPGARWRRLSSRAAGYTVRDLPRYRAEIVLLMMAGFIGAVGSGLLAPVVRGAGLHLELVPAWALLLSALWLMPLAGQIGMNPILAASLLAPLLPSPEAMGVSPEAVVCAFTAGWAVAGASSPYTASTLMLAAFSGTTARRVGLVWNGAYALVCGAALSAWVLCIAYLL
ncbi:hypothetical protein SAMN05444336_1015 [Albimonas donghaensis]|uniref:H+/citrate symporter n=1 Tax=Albimonas donghaensis TaxID=356660 RepID=A0A1H2QBQ1_9RHOB|nr:hypothetical protein [Albimonas donghaensis]SDW04552.1 hypothetical protein SAMN05444336_1015 [Albimonas donghaensis]